jgi:hypothetical protein
MIKKIIILVVAGLMTFTAGVAFAKNKGKLPKGAVPLSAEEVKAIYVGKTIDWKPAKAYWSADGTTIGYYPVKGDEAFAEGTWSVNGNELCYENTWHGKDKTKPFNEKRCSKYYKVKKVIWTENTKDDDKWQGDIWTGVEKKLKKGDSVSKKALELKAKLGY